MEAKMTTCGVFSSEEACFVLTSEKLPNCVFNELRKSEELVDVRLEVGNKQLAAHRVVLAATIPYFRTMFTINMRERVEDVITIKANLDESSFEAIIDYAYGGDIRITTLNVKSLMAAASYFQLDRVSKTCLEFVEQRLNVTNVFEFKAVGDALGYPSLAKSVNTFIIEHFEEVFQLEQFWLLSCNELIDIISNNELKVTNEEKVFEAVIKWVKQDENARKHDLPHLLSHVRLPCLTPEYLYDCVGSEQLVVNSPACLNLWKEATIYHFMPKRRHMLQSVVTTPRCSARARLIYVVGGQNNYGDTVNTVEVYNHNSNTWTTENAMTSSREGLGLAVLDHKLYAIGGYDTADNECLSAVEVFDAKTKCWTNITPMNCKRRYFGAATFNDKLYVCGGLDGATDLDTVECYKHEQDEWQMMPSMSQRRSEFQAVAFQGSIVALGGCSNLNDALDSVERYDPQSETWTGMPSMLTKRYGPGAAVVGNKIYVCGGCDGSYSTLQTAEVFDPQTNKWSFIASMNVKRNGVSLVANGGKLFAIGGRNEESEYLSSVEMYNPETNEWSLVAPMSEPRWFAASVVF